MPAARRPPPLALALAGATPFLHLYAPQGALPMLARTFGASAPRVGWVVGATTVGIALAAPFVGALADTIGRKRVIIAASLALAAPAFLASTAGSLAALIAWRFALGLVMPAIFAVTIAYIGEEHPPGMSARGMGAYVAGNIVGGVAGRLLCAALAARLGWRQAFAVLAASSLATSAALWATLPRARRFVPRRGIIAALRGGFAHLGDRRTMLGCLVGLGVLFSIVATFTYVGFYLAGPPFGIGTAALGSVFLVYLVGLASAPLAGRAVASGIDQRTVFGAAMVVAASGIALTLWARPLSVIAGLTLCAFGTFACQTVAGSYAGNPKGRARPSPAGMYVALYYIGGALGATIPGLAWRAGGWPACVGLVVAVQAATTATALVWLPGAAPRFAVDAPRERESCLERSPE